ncbi:MAG: 3-isopropylmalate dehydratase small subunit [Comamonadaceae bacterium]|nr:MAG: 3-isopropylmalate dehydratase small subunit [Comamonadaceae bacterium]
MESFVKVSGIAVPMLQINIDTDQITPGKDLIRMHKEGYAPSLFANLRYIGERTPNPAFILNQEPWSRGVFLLADRNFGCGSSRETAPKALREYGFRAVIAPSFAGIFFSNSFRNGLVPVELPIEQVSELARQMEAAKGHAQITVDLREETVTAPDGTVFSFSSPRVLRQMLLEGLDEIGVTLSRSAEIEAFRAADRAARPWAY